MSFCWASVITFGHQFEALSTVAGASQMWFDAMLTMDTSVFYDQVSDASVRAHAVPMSVVSVPLSVSLSVSVCLLATPSEG